MAEKILLLVLLLTCLSTLTSGALVNRPKKTLSNKGDDDSTTKPITQYEKDVTVTYHPSTVVKKDVTVTYHPSTVVKKDVTVTYHPFTLVKNDVTVTYHPSTVVKKDSSKEPRDVHNDKPIVIEMPKREDFDTLNPTHVNGHQLYQGDVMLSDEQRAAMAERKAILPTTYRWPEGTNGWPSVPYAFGDSNVDQLAVLAGIDHWEKHTCITFHPTSDLSTTHLSFILGSGCWSYIGRISSFTDQGISIGNGCSGLGVVAHEIGHAMGFFHEQSRSDRDQYVIIKFENIQSGREGNFAKASPSSASNYSVPYDYSSVMHYGANFFSSNGGKTIIAKNILAQSIIGNRYGLTHRDILLANRMYGCIDKWVVDCGLANDPCQNDGYLVANCSCVCPTGTSGTNCETITGTYYDFDDCSSEVTTDTAPVTSPNYPSTYPLGVTCLTTIKAPACLKIQLTFTAFQLLRTNCGGLDCCVEKLDIRDTDPYQGTAYCGQDIAPGTVITSAGNIMYLLFETYVIAYNYEGYSADIAFVPDPNCGLSTPSISTSTSTTTTTAPPVPHPCLFEFINGKYYWTSPHFGIEDYPNNQNCNLTGTGTGYPTMTVFKYVTFKLQGKVKRKCVDYVTFLYPYGVEKKVCGVQKRRKMKLPYMNFRLDFKTNSRITDVGFNISVTTINSPCYQLNELTSVGETGDFSTPNYPAFDKRKKRTCEIWISSPVGTKVQLEFLDFQLQTPCKKNNLVVNLVGDKKYPRGTSSRYCGNTLPPTMVSSGNIALLVFQGKNKNKGFLMQYTAIAA